MTRADRRGHHPGINLPGEAMRLRRLSATDRGH
jgi:hypothetical protein